MTELTLIKPQEDTKLQEYYTEALKLQQYADVRVIATLEDAQSATNDLAIISGIKKSMEERRKDYLRPFQDHIKDVNEGYKQFMEPIMEADRITRSKWTAFTLEMKRQQAEQEEINRLRMEAANKEMELNGELSESVNLVEVQDAPKRTSTAMGSTGMKDSWRFEVFDFALLPDAYKVADEVMLGQIARKHHDQKPVPGVNFYNEPVIAVNRR
ncbi:hypothetical protein LCGC14_2112120 [marine sediment metagenome]|uniref:Uncharacterized protein n=1 Tax=marine sediment metagenome TaxID=412755 RepID=A0A0F9E6Q5_9ZZZZ